MHDPLRSGIALAPSLPVRGNPTLALGRDCQPHPGGAVQVTRPSRRLIARDVMPRFGGDDAGRRPRRENAR